MLKHYLIKHYRAIAIGILAMIIIFAIAMRAKPPAVLEYESYYVQKNDTLWAIATAIKPDNVDVRMVIYAIAEVNRIDKDHIYENQVLQVPVYED